LVTGKIKQRKLLSWKVSDNGFTNQLSVLIAKMCPSYSVYVILEKPTDTNRAGLKPMQPMQLHWARRLWGPRAMVFG